MSVQHLHCPSSCSSLHGFGNVVFVANPVQPTWVPKNLFSNAVLQMTCLPMLCFQACFATCFLVQIVFCHVCFANVCFSLWFCNVCVCNLCYQSFEFAMWFRDVGVCDCVLKVSHLQFDYAMLVFANCV